MDIIISRRADSPHYETAYDEHTNSTRRPSGDNPDSRYVLDPSEYGDGFGSGYGSRFGSSYNGGSIYPLTQKHREKLPRNAMRPYRQDNDEPADSIRFLRQTRCSVCRDGQHRSTCSECAQAVITHARAGRPSKTTPYQGFMMSPQRVFRDIIMTDVGEPLAPALRDALLGVFSQMSKETKEERTFNSFSLLPFEIRHIIWEAALPSRVLLREDLCHTTYRGTRKTFRPGSHVYTIEELWQSDLFYVCVESRRVVTALVRGADPRTEAGRPAIPMYPPRMGLTTRAQLRAGLDVLYYPWLGSKKAHDRGGGGPIRHGPPYIALPEDAASEEGPDGQESCCACHPPKKNAATGGASTATLVGDSIAPYPINRIPYGHWASQLRILRVPATTVALDMAWIDKQHPDTLAWAVGVDLSEPLDCDRHDQYAHPKPVPPECLKVVLADITIPVHVDLDACSSPEQRQRLQRHVYAHPTATAAAAATANSRQPQRRGESESDAGSEQGRVPNLNGKDYTVLVDLYDDRRIEELLSLARASDGGHEIVNKSALHRCIGCTRQAWEARSSASPTAWSSQFGDLVGDNLQTICRPTILFSIVLAFDKVGSYVVYEV